MIRLLVKLGQWLDARFPARVVVQEKDYLALQAKLEALEVKLEGIQRQAVHKDAVKDLVEVVRLMKEDFQSFKTSLGFSRQNSPEISAMLNGQYISEEPHNG